MSVREKLIELIVWIEDQMTRAYPYTTDQFRIETTVDHLIANGVTVQEWISVDDKLPEQKENAICINRHGDMMIGTYTEWGWMFPCYFESPTHWMPMPPFPKGE